MRATPRSSSDSPRSTRWSIAVVAGNAGDTLRERSELETMQRELGNDPEHEKLLHLVRERLNPTRK